MDRKRLIWTLAALAVLAAGARLAAMAALRSWNSPSAMEHEFIAWAMTKGWGFWFSDFGHLGPTSVQSPVYPSMLYVAFKVFGAHAPGAYAAMMALNAIIGAGVVVLAYLVGRTMGAGVKAALLAAGLYAVWPSQIYAATMTQAVVLITAVQAAMVVLFYRGVRTGRAGPWIGFSVVACAGALTEPALLPISALSGLLVLNWPTLDVASRLRNAGILLLAAVLIIGPWSVRNRQTFGKWIPIKGTFWVNVWKGANDYATGTDRVRLTEERKKELVRSQLLALKDQGVRDPANDVHHRQMLTNAQTLLLWGKDEMGQDAVFRYWATSWIREHPRRFAELCLARLWKTVWIDWDNPKSWNVMYVVPRGVLLAGTAAGLVVAVRRRWALLYPGLLIVSCLALYTMTLTAARFSLPFEVVQLCLSAQAAMAGWEWARAKMGAGRGAMASAALEAS